MSDTVERKPWKQMTSAEKRARSAFLKAERKARRLALEEKWKTQVAAHFDYLETDYGFHFVSVDGSKWWGTYVYYQSPLLQIQFDLSVEFDSVEIQIARLIDGQVPKYPIFINPDTPINHIYLNQVLSERAPEESEKLLAMRGLGEEQVERSLAFQSGVLRSYCDDILRGDFAIFDMIAEQLHQNAREHPQEIKVWLPDTAQPGEEKPLVDFIRENYPQQPLVIGRYSTKKRAKTSKGEYESKASRAASIDEQPSEPS